MPRDAASRESDILRIEACPTQLAKVLTRLEPARLGALYREWSAEQIVGHLADSHMHSYIRFKWALTEDQPTIKAYDEGRWAQLPDVPGSSDIAAARLQALHRQWVRLMRCMNDDDFGRCFFHPESRRLIPLDELVQYYAWHGEHHLAQLQWIAEYR